jgi:hypothetical protein
MSIYIQDNETNTVRQYCTSPEVEKAIETLLKTDSSLAYSETNEGYEAIYKELETYRVRDRKERNKCPMINPYLY